MGKIYGHLIITRFWTGLWLVFGVIPLVSGCARFNLPIEAEEYFVLGSSTSPRVQVFRLMTGGNSIARVAALDPTYGASLAGSEGFLLSYSGSGLSGVSLLGATQALLGSRAITSMTGATVTPERNAVFYGDGAGDLVRVRSLSGGVLSSTDTQSLAVNLGGGTADHFAFSSDNSRVIVAVNSGGGAAMVSRTADGRLGSVLGTWFFGPDNYFLENVPALGPEYYIYDILGGTPYLGRVTASGNTFVGSALATAFAPHPSRPWLVGGFTNQVQVFLLTTSGVSLLRANNVPARALPAFAGMFKLNSAGDRVVEYTTAPDLRLYSLDSTGAVALLQTVSVSAATSLTRVAIGRNLP